MPRVLTVLLVADGKGQLHPYFEDPDFQVSLPEGNQATRWARLQARIASLYYKVEKKFPLQERLLGRFRLVEEVRVLHPADLPLDQAQSFLLGFVRKYARRHRKWTIIDGGLAALGAVLFWIPGPNVFFLYPALRTAGHYFARVGGETFLTMTSSNWAANEILTQIGAATGDERRRLAADLQTYLGWTAFDEFVSNLDRSS